jgi:hypothetical protein
MIHIKKDRSQMKLKNNKRSHGTHGASKRLLSNMREQAAAALHKRRRNGINLLCSRNQSLRFYTNLYNLNHSSNLLHHIIDDKTNDIMGTKEQKVCADMRATPVAAVNSSSSSKTAVLGHSSGWQAMAMKSFRLEGMAVERLVRQADAAVFLSSDESDDGLHGPEMIMVSLRPKAVLIQARWLR